MYHKINVHVLLLYYVAVALDQLYRNNDKDIEMIDIPSYSISNGSSMKQCMCYASDTYVPVEMMMLLTITKGKQSNQGA